MGVRYLGQYIRSFAWPLQPCRIEVVRYWVGGLLELNCSYPLGWLEPAAVAAAAAVLAVLPEMGELLKALVWAQPGLMCEEEEQNKQSLVVRLMLEKAVLKRML